MKDFTEFISAVSGTDFDEIPVDPYTFITSPDYLNESAPSDLQLLIIKKSSQIYKKSTLVSIYGEEDGIKRFTDTCQEVILCLGKGSGKDWTATISLCYIVYLLLCLKDPAKYYGKGVGDAIDIVNIAINADQAKNVFFKGFKGKIERSPWFAGKFEVKNNSIEFDKNITVYSGHSEREAFEGLNLFLAVLDEISGFALESNTGNDRANTADATYQMYRASVDSRFPDFGKVLLLSFPRSKRDYILQKYEGDPENDIMGAVAEKEVITRHHTFKINEELPDGVEGNEFEIEWEEDHILRYTLPGIFALRRPTWEVNPGRSIDDFKRAFYTNKSDALGRFAAMPSDTMDNTFIKNKQAVDDAFVLQNGVDSDGIFSINFQPKAGKEYYIHVDLSKVHDRCAVSMAHVDKWVMQEMNYMKETYPSIRVDAIRWWQPSKDEPMDYNEVTNYILALKRKGFDIKLVTFDRWSSHDTMNFLESKGIKTELLSVANKHYDDLLSVLYDDRLMGPNVSELITELKELRWIKDKIDHPRTGYKDISDSVCGAVFNAISRTRRPQNQEVEIVSYKKLMRQQEQEKQSEAVIKPPKRTMPKDLADQLHEIRLDQIKII